MKFSYKRMEEVFLLLAANKDIPVPVNSFCRKLNITDRTLRTDINSLNDLIHSEDIEIQLIRGKGYQLFSQSNDSSSIYMIQKEILSKRTETERLDSSEDRLFYIVRKLLYATKPIPIETISETIFVAESTIYSYLKPIRALVKKYNLRLKNRTNLGLSIEGNEIDKRRLITNVLVEHNFTEYISGYTEIEQKLFQDIELEKINYIFDYYFGNFITEITDFKRKNILFHIALCISRCKSNYSLKLDTINKVALPDTMIDNFEKMLKAYEDEFDILIPKTERNYLAYHILGNAVEIWATPSKRELQVEQYVTILLKNIDDFFHNKFELSKDTLLISDMLWHINAILKLKYFQRMEKNPILNDIKTNYPLSYEATSTCVSILGEKFPFEFTPDDIGYITLHIEAAIKRKQVSFSKRKRILLVCGSGNATSRILQAELETNIPNIEIVDKSSLKNYQHILLTKPVDCIISTLPIIDSIVPTLIVDISNINKEIQIISDFLANLDYHPTKKSWHLFDKQLFFPNLHMYSKFEAIKYVCDNLEQDCFVSNNFYDDVIARENIAETYIRNGIAISHPLDFPSPVTKIAIATFNTPINWSNTRKQVKLLFLIIPGEKYIDELDYFFDLLLPILDNKQKRQQLQKATNLLSFINHFEKI